MKGKCPDKLTDSDVKMVGGHEGNMGSHVGINAVPDTRQAIKGDAQAMGGRKNAAEAPAKNDGDPMKAVAPGGTFGQ